MIKNLINSTKLDLPFDAWNLRDDDNISIILVQLKKGEEIPLHINDVNVIFL